MLDTKPGRKAAFLTKPNDLILGKSPAPPKTPEAHLRIGDLNGGERPRCVEQTDPRATSLFERGCHAHVSTEKFGLGDPIFAFLFCPQLFATGGTLCGGLGFVPVSDCVKGRRSGSHRRGTLDCVAERSAELNL
jgi:hypothetical protein